MAQNGEIIIKIVGDGGSSNVANGNSVGAASSVSPSGKVEAVGSASSSGLMAAGGALENAVMVAMLKKAGQELFNITMQEANYEISKYYRMSDNYLAQQQVNVANNIVNKTAGTAMSIAAGFAVGGPVGAAIAGISSILSTGLDIYRNYDQENIQLRQMDASLSFNRQKAGFSLTADSIGENK